MLERNRQLAAAGLPGGVPDHFYDGPHNYSPYGRDRAEEAERFDPLQLLSYVVRYRWLIAFMAAFGLVAGFVVSMMQTPKYRATATIEVMVPTARVIEDMQVVSETNGGWRVSSFITAKEKFRSRSLAERVVFQLGLAEKPEFLFPKPDFSLINIFYRAFGLDRSPSIDAYTPEQREKIAIGRVLGGLSVSIVPETSLLRVSFSHQNPGLASDVANQISQSFIDQRVDQTSETSDLARQFIQEQVIQTKDRLQRSEEELVAYAKNAGITVTGSERSLIDANIEAINAALSEAVRERLDYGRLVQQIDAGRGSSLTPVLESKGLESLKEKLAELEAEYQQKLGLLKPGFPEMQQLSARIRELKKQIEAGVLTIIDSIRLKHEETISKEADLRAKLADLQTQQVEFNDKNIQYTILKREVDSNRAQYDSLIAKLNDVGVGSELKNQNAAIVDLATRPGGPYSPRPLLNMGIALAMFLGLCAAIIYVLELLNNTFSDPEQVEKELGLPVLGILPLVAEKTIADGIADQNSALSEAHRTLRTSLQFSGAEGMPRTLLVTSSEPSECKSTTAFKLAHDFASLGTRVLVIDGDLRKPSQHRLFGVANTIGLSNLLTNTVRKADMPGLIKQSRFGTVFVLTSGTIPPNPADLLSSSRMAVIVNNLSSRFDLVVIDAPPIVGLSDAPILGRLAEGTLFVVSMNQVTRKSAKSALKRLRAAGANVIGVAMSRFAPNKLDYSYAYKHDQYYKYGVDTPKLESRGHGAEQPHHARASLVARLAGSISDRFNSYIARARSIS